MDKSQFLKQIISIQEKRKNLFTQRIRNSEKYRRINTTPSNQLEEDETQLLLAVESFDRHIFYGSEDMLLQVKPADWEVFTVNAEKKLFAISQLLNQINWDE